MKNLLLAIGVLVSCICSGQSDPTRGNIAIGGTALGGNTTGSSSTQLGYGIGTAGVYWHEKKYEPKKILQYDTVKCIVIYLDGDGLVKGDQGFKISKATLTKMQYYPPAPCTYYNGVSIGTCAVFHGGITKEEPDFQLYRVVTTCQKEIPLQSIIQYK